MASAIILATSILCPIDLQAPPLFHYSGCLIAESEGKAIAGPGGYDPNALGYPALQ